MSELSCGTCAPRPPLSVPTALEEPELIGVCEALALSCTGVLLVDVRPPGEFDSCHLRTSVSAPAQAGAWLVPTYMTPAGVVLVAQSPDELTAGVALATAAGVRVLAGVVEVGAQLGRSPMLCASAAVAGVDHEPAHVICLCAHPPPDPAVDVVFVSLNARAPVLATDLGCVATWCCCGHHARLLASWIERTYQLTATCLCAPTD